MSCGISSEAGEVADLIKKMSRAGHESLDFMESKDIECYDDFRRKMLLELGDTLWYITRMAVVFGIPLEEIMRFNKSKLTRRQQVQEQQQRKGR